MLCTSFPSALPPFSIIAGWDHSQAKICKTQRDGLGARWGVESHRQGSDGWLRLLTLNQKIHVSY